MPGPTMPAPTECVPTMPMYTMPVHTGPMHTVSDSIVPIHTVPTYAMPQPTVPGPTLSDSKTQPDMSSLAVHSSTPPAPVVPQPQVVLVKQFQPPKPYTGATSWKGYREYFERLATVNG